MHLVMEAGAVERGVEAGLLGKPVQMTAHVAQQHAGQIVGKPIADNSALQDNLLTIGRHLVGWHLPAAIAEPVRQVVKGPVPLRGLFQRPGDDRKIAPGGEDLEGTEFLNSPREFDCNLLASLVHGAVA